MLDEFTKSFPKKIGHFLDLSNGLKRKFGEETITDLLMGALVPFKPWGLQVDFPIEPVTGADMEWLFFNPLKKCHFRLLIQAKKIYGKGKIWSRRSYKEIFHTVGSPPSQQSQILVGEALKHKATYPLYILYTNQTVCDQANAAGKSNVDGVSFVSAHFVNKKVIDKKAKKINAAAAASLKIMQPKMFPLSKILFNSRLSIPKVTFPDEVINCVKLLMENNILSLFLDEKSPIELIAFPDPEQIRNAIIENSDDHNLVPEVSYEEINIQEESLRATRAGRFFAVFHSGKSEDFQ